MVPGGAVCRIVPEGESYRHSTRRDSADVTL
jgi:hypothetical protein